jgi:hypothetical protein
VPIALGPWLSGPGRSQVARCSPPTDRRRAVTRLGAGSVQAVDTA